MQIDLTTVVQWVVTAVAGFLSWLMYHYSHSMDNRFVEQSKALDTLAARIEKLEDRVTITVPQSLDSLRNEINALDSKVADLGAKVATIDTRVTDNYVAFIKRVDRLEDSMPTLIEGVFYKLFLRHPLMTSYVKESNEANN